MKITHTTTRAISMPLDDPLFDGLTECVTLELGTDEGLVGLGLTYLADALTPALKSATETLAGLAIGADPTRVEHVRAMLLAAAGSSGPSGLFSLALAAVDIACWDIKAKASSTSVWALLGGARDRVPAYASGALIRARGIDELQAASHELVKRGFRAMKVQCGSERTITASVERVRVLREALGPDVDLMCDINQLWGVQHAIDFGRRCETLRLSWLEDPTTHDDTAGLARIADSLVMPVAGGEYLYGLGAFRQLLEARSVDIVMIDLARVGGVTPWIKVAAMAEACNVPVVSHLVPELHGHLVAAIPNGLTVEYIPWAHRLFDTRPTVENGELIVPQKPGFGLAFDHATLDRYQVA